MQSPLEHVVLFHVGPVPISEPVVVTWLIMAGLGLFAFLSTRKLAILPSKTQTVLELFVTVLDDQIRETMRRDPAPFRPLIGTLLRLLTLRGGIARIGRRFGLTARLVAMEKAEACIDADKPDDVVLIERIVAARG